MIARAYRILTVASFCIGTIVSGVHAETGNRLDLSMIGDGNVLDLSQTWRGAGADNTLTLSIDGDRNGGGGAFDPLLGAQAAPGTIAQTGAGNALSLSVLGSDNLFSAVQDGTGNAATIAITGAFNQTVLSQTGTNNTAAIVQAGNANRAVIRQSGR